MAYQDSLQPSTPFDNTRPSPTTHIPTGQLTSANRPSSSINSILAHSMESKPQFDTRSTLMSPPEPCPLETFSQPATTPQKTMFAKPAANFPLSPPVSPFTQTDGADDSRSVAIKDPILYPQSDAPNTSNAPLFDEATEALTRQRQVDRHLAARDSDIFREASPPRPEEYKLVLEFKSKVARAYNSNRNLWFRRERQFLLEDRALQSGKAKRYPTIAPHPPRPRNLNASKPKVKPAGPRSPITRQPRPPKPVRATTPGEGKTARTDKDFTAIPDYSPPISSLPKKANSLKVDWRGAPIELKNDSHFHALHPDEVALAANLRLDCATYLTSKRRIFERRLECLRIGKEFRKTDAQQACKIDVNKASKLWQAFDKVGWLDPSWVQQYL
ncbi:SWIRM domain-containing protein [Phlyctema vagabunda]|uniref:SWIRM domain-containing protein n=1 Tax=Phlyctema vagabunda TaxID=108571 RepID=A0ABR4P6Z6_9HELO